MPKGRVFLAEIGGQTIKVIVVKSIVPFSRYTERMGKTLCGVYQKPLMLVRVFVRKKALATYSNCGELLRAFTTTWYRRLCQGTRVMTDPNGNNVKDWTIRIQASLENLIARISHLKGSFSYGISMDFEFMGEIYSITSPSGKKYIGQANCFIKKGKIKKPHGTDGRWVTHITDAKGKINSCPVLNNAIRKYGAHTMVVRTLIRCPLGMLDYYEKKYIRQFNTNTPFGYNLKSGGLGCTHAPETIAKMSASHTGERNWNYGNRGKETSEETKYFLSTIKKGKQIAKESNIQQWTYLPQYIYYKFETARALEGFKVKNHPYIPPKMFSNMSLTMEQKLALAVQYLKDNTRDYDEASKKNNRGMWKDLPQYIYYKFESNAIEGFRVRQHPTLKDKTFTKATLTMEQKLELAKEYIASIDTREEGSTT
jgi:NUMOD3 motif